MSICWSASSPSLKVRVRALSKVTLTPKELRAQAESFTSLQSCLPQFTPAPLSRIANV
jgi:hypothetical protein